MKKVSTSFLRSTLRKPTGLLALSAILALGINRADAQTTIISPTGDGGFENGATLTANGWTEQSYAANNTNKWFVGTAAVASAGSNSAYISNDASGLTYNYSNSNASRVMFWRDVVFPAGETSITLTFKIKGAGEDTYDDCSVFIQNGATVPNVTTQPSSSGSSTPSITGTTRLATLSVLGTTYVTRTYTIAAADAGNTSAATTRRLIIYWENDGSDGANPPASIDEISLVSAPPPPPPVNDDPAGAIALTVNANYACGTTTSGTTVSATPSTAPAPTCSATGVNDDVWFTFVASSSTHRVSFSNVTNGTMVSALYTGTPGALSFVTSACASTTLNATGLTPGTTYYVRAYTSTATVTTTTGFTICIGTLPPPPANDNCAGAIAFPVIPTTNSCVSVIANTQSATQSLPACAGTADEDVWYSFVCPAGYTSLLYENTDVSGSSDRVIEFFSGNCGNLTSILCQDAESGMVTGLVAGQTYYLRIHTYSSGNVTEVNVCLKTPPLMTYVSSTTTQSTTSAVAAGGVSQQIIGIQVVTNGLANPLSLNELTFNTNGTTAAADITAAKVYSTGTSSSFGTTTLFGSPVANPNGSFTVTGSQVLSGGLSNTTNYFWLVYDINCAATAANVLDAECTSINVGSAQTPTVTAPSGSRAINAASFTATTNQPSTSTVLSGSTDQQVLRVALTGCASSTVSEITFSTAGSTAPADIATAKVFFTTTTTFATTTPFGTPVATPNGNFTVTGSQLLMGATGYFWLVYNIASNATAANVVDASCVAAVISGNTATPVTPNPTGTRAIVAAAINDMPAGAITLSMDTACTSTYSNTNSTLNSNEPRISCKGSQTESSQVWFKFVAPPSGFVRVSTDYASTSLDTKMGLFSATNPSDLSTFTIISCDDDGGVAGNSSAIYASGLTPGSTYYFAVAHYNTTATGAFCADVKEVTSAMLAAPASCAALQTVAGMLSTYTGWFSLTDAAGNLVAQVQQTAGTATEFSGAVTAVTGSSRTDVAGMPYLNRNYHINGANATAANLKLYFSNTEVSSLGSALNTLNVSRVPGTTCTPNFSGTATVLSQTTSNSVNGISWIEVSTPGFSNFFINSGAVPLPVKLKSFTGKNAGTANNLNWETAEEKNFSHFELQRSADGIHFSSLVQVTSDRNSTGSKYAYTDASPLEGINIYRLNMVDRDGKSSLSEIVTLTVKGGKGIAVQVYPNPVKETLQISIAGKADGQARIQVLDITGKTLRTIMLNNNAGQVDMHNLPAGMYLVRYTDNSHSSVTKITKE